MAFGTTQVPKDLESVYAQPEEEAFARALRERGEAPPPSVPLEETARKQQAAHALFEGARLGLVKLMGSPGDTSDRSEPIPPTYFDIPRSLGWANDSIETDLDQISMEVYVDVRKGRHQRWFNVRVDAGSFRKWLTPARTTQKAQKCPAIKAAIKAVGVELNGPLTKTDKADVVARVKKDTGLNVHERTVKSVFRKMQQRGT